MSPAHELRMLVEKFSAELVEIAKQEAFRRVCVAFGMPERSYRGRARIVECVQAKPGLLVEQIEAVLGMPASELAPLVRQLVSDEVLITRGTRLGIRYYVLTEAERGRDSYPGRLGGRQRLARQWSRISRRA